MTPQPKSRTYLSVCSGIEACTVAWHPLGWTPLAFSELAKFPRRVLAHHYPDVPLHGDFTLLRDQPWIAGADVLVGGTPCQSFSIAGLRGGLSDSRGNLTLEFVRLANAIDDLRPAADPATILWENVPGVLSSRDNAFGALLAGLGGCDAPIVNAGGWPGAGVVAGPRRVVAWRVLDAQFFGVAQRRRRVFVLACGRSAPCWGWSAADALLPIQEGGGRDSAPVRESQKAFAGQSAGRPNDTGKWPATISPTLNAQFGSKLGLEHQHIDGGAGMFVPTLAPCLETQKGGLRHPDTQAYVVGAIPASLGKGLGHNKDEFVVPQAHGGVRRLTPMECERLQGFPDNYTAIPGAADGPRYAALGNSMAVPVMAWIGKRIGAVRQA
jgi:DNA (cytosine-5)-methyltransferase 1